MAKETTPLARFCEANWTKNRMNLPDCENILLQETKKKFEENCGLVNVFILLSVMVGEVWV